MSPAPPVGCPIADELPVFTLVGGGSFGAVVAMAVGGSVVFPPAGGLASFGAEVATSVGADVGFSPAGGPALFVVVVD